MTGAPSPFAASNPRLQRAWDSTSFRALMTCPRKYQYSILEGWRPPGASVHLEFGGFFASAAEIYKKARLAGMGKQPATLAALRYTIEASWDTTPGEDGECPGPWGGRYETMWRCTGDLPYKNARGNRAKCPWAHSGVWVPGPSGDTCGECGSATHTERRWISDDNSKDRYTLVRLVAWYCDEQPETPAQGPFPYAFPNGQPAVELSFQLPLPWKTPYSRAWDTQNYQEIVEGGEPYLLCGHLDSIMQYGTERFIADNKTTKNALGQAYFAGFTPDIQVDVYDLAGSLLYPGLELRGVMVEGAQTMVEGARFGVGVQYRTDTLREELLDDLRYWLDQAEQHAERGRWPMNRASCKMCEFKSICGKEPSKRQQYLESNFVKRKWNPLMER